MEIKVKQMPMPIDNDTVKDLHRVDYRLVGGFGCSRWKTFGVYESKEVAVFVAEQIRKGYVII